MNYSNVRGLLSQDDRSEGEKIRLLVVGSREGAIEVIHSLHSLRYAEASAWSRLLPLPDEEAVISILTRYRKRN